MSWQRTTLCEVATIVMGQSPPGSTYNEIGQGLPFYQGVKDFGSRYPTKHVYCTAPTRIAEEGDILFSVRAPIGSINRANEKCSIGRGLSIVRAHNGDDFDFIEYLLKSMNRAWGAYESQGAIFGNARRRDLEDLQIAWPPHSVRVQIASILSAYDDLIENNRRRIRLLEESARLLYREWFVRLRFPGHEHVKIIDGVPEGWEKKRLIDIAELIMGQSPKSIFYNDKGEGLPFHQGVTNFGERFVEHKTYCTTKNRIAENSDILCSVRAPVGRLNITLDRIIIGRGLSSIRSKLDHQSFLYYNLKEHFFKEDMIGGGAIFAAVTKKDMENQKLLCPPTDMIEKFEDISDPIDEQLKVLHTQNIKLKQARDLLLPRLMNGEIEV